MNMTRAWDKEKFWVPDRNWTHDLPNTGRALSSTPERLPGVQEVMGSISVRDSEFFFVPRSCHVD